MPRLKLFLALGLLAAFVYTACHKEAVSNYGSKVTFTIAGRVVDENDQPVFNALVEAGGESATTDENGVFRINDIKDRERNAIVHVKKSGYFEFSRALIAKEGSIQNLNIQLLGRDAVASVSASSGGLVFVDNDVQLSFPPNSVVDANGNNYSGEIRIFAKSLRPDDPNLSRKMPGDLRATNSAGDEGVLSTFGMVGVELESFAGEPLKIAEGKTVTINMAIDPSQASVAPEEIALWYYDHETARWIEEGSAQKSGNKYVGEVKHFSFWNCDAFSETVYMDGNVYLLSRATPLANASIRLTVLSNGFQGFALTDGNGYFGGAVPKGYAMRIEVLLPDICGGQILYTADIGPFDTDTSLPDIILNDPSFNTFQISGSLKDCDGQAVENGYIIISTGGLKFPAFTLSDGSFSANLIDCSLPVSGEVKAYDLTDLKISNPVPITIDGNDIQVGDIVVCNELEEYIQYKLDQQTFTSTAPYGFYLNGATVISSSQEDSLQGGQYIRLMFNNNGQASTFPVTDLSVNNFWANPNSAINMTVTVIEPGTTIGSVMSGNFQGNFTATDGSVHDLSGSYRVFKE